MEQFAERLSQLAEMSDEDLGALESEMVEAFDAADSAGDVENMQSLADALDQVREEMTRRSGEEEPMAASAEADTESTENDAAEDAADEPVEDEVSDLTADEVPEENKPEPEAVTASAPTIRVGGDVPGFTAGAELSSMDDVVDALTAKVNSMRGIGGDGEHVLVASIRHETDVPEDRTLRPGDANGNSRKIRELISDPEQLTADALTAAGWCAPKAPVYDVPTIGTTDRPIRDALPSFNADRGGITWMEPPSLAGVESTNDDTFAVWDGTTDKPCYTIECGEEATATLDALTMCLCFDNLTARAFPEWIRANTELTMVAQARWAEQYLLGKMWGTLTTGTASGSVVGTPDLALGAARDFLTALRIVAAQFRWSNRISPTTPLQLVAPTWLNEAMAADLAIQAPGDGTLSVSYGEINGYLSDLNIQPIWYIDDLPTGSGASPASTAGSNFDSKLGFPTVAEWLLFPTGTFVRLDAGTLDLGIVRNKEDVQQNKYCEFSETFETVAYMGPATNGWAIRGRTAIEVIGGTAAGVDTAAGTIGS